MESQLNFVSLAQRFDNDDQPGDLLSHWDESELSETAPLLATLPADESVSEPYVPVTFQSRITELGVFELWCVSAAKRRPMETGIQRPRAMPRMKAVAESPTEFDPLIDKAPARYVVGIDLGTTNSAVSYVDTHESPWRVRLLALPQLVAAPIKLNRAIRCLPFTFKLRHRISRKAHSGFPGTATIEIGVWASWLETRA